jgi:hypothetical protein
MPMIIKIPKNSGAVGQPDSALQIDKTHERRFGTRPQRRQSGGVPRHRCAACQLYRRMLPNRSTPGSPTPARALCADEQQTVLDNLRSERFSDKASAEAVATLINKGIYLYSIHTKHLILA